MLTKSDSTELQQIIETGFAAYVDKPKSGQNSNSGISQSILLQAVHSVMEYLDKGRLRIAQKHDTVWHINTWVKQAILLYFKFTENKVIGSSDNQWYDKIPLKYQNFSPKDWMQQNARVVPGAILRKGAFIAPNTVIMPAYINIGAYVDTGTMIDTWATIGSCAQIGKDVHIAGGAGIGGVLEPLQATPTIIEDKCFIGARSEIVEGVIVEEGSVISMGVYIGQSTRIYDRISGRVSYGRIPAGSVVVPGSLPASDGSHSIYCAVIVKQVDPGTLSKIELNAILREYTV